MLRVDPCETLCHGVKRQWPDMVVANTVATQRGGRIEASPCPDEPPTLFQVVAETSHREVVHLHTRYEIRSAMVEALFRI